MKPHLTTCLLLALALPGAIAAQPVLQRDRAQSIAGWRITSGGSGDGGYMAELTRRTRSWSFRHYVEYWRGNGGVVIADEFHHGACASLGENGIVRFAYGTSRRHLEQQLASYLRECPLPPAQAAELRRSFARAWPHFLRHVRRQRAALDAELAWIARGSPAR